MKTTTTQFKIIADLCRYNTGASILDSGSAYGRHHEKPAILPEAKAVTLECWGKGSGKLDEREPDITSTIELAHYLNEAVTVDEERTAQFEAFVEADDTRDDWFKMGSRFCESLGLHQHARDNVCNHENDLSQAFVWEMWSHKAKEQDWINAEDPLCVIYIHTGCDVRGGYARPLFCRANGEYAVPMYTTAEFWAHEGVDESGEPLSSAELEHHCDRWQCGYSNCPSSAFSKDVESIVEFQEGEDWVCVKLKTGETVKVYAEMPNH